MKRLILFLSLFVCISTQSLFAQEEQEKQEYVTDLEAEKLIDKYIDKIDSKIKSVYDGPIKDYAAIVKRKIIVGSIIEIGVAIILFSTTVFFFLGRNASWDKPYFGMTDSDDCTTPFTIFLVISVIVGTPLLWIGLTGLLATDYYVVKEIVELVR